MVEPVETSPPEEPPLLRIVKGDPRPEEVAALVAVVSALAAAGGGDDRPRARSEWASPRRAVRGLHQHGPGAWRASGLPR